MQFCDADIVITNRIDNQTSGVRKLATSAFHLVFTRALFGIRYDTQSGLKLFKKHVLQEITINPSGWTFDLEFIIRSLENQYTILSEDILFGERYAGEAKINLASAAFEGAWQSIKLRRTSSNKRVKAQYKHLQPLQQRSARGFTTLAGLVVGLALLSAISMAHTSALTLQPVEVPLTTTLTATNPLTNLLDQALDTTNSTPSSSSTATQNQSNGSTSLTNSDPTAAATVSAGILSSPVNRTIYVAPASSKTVPTADPTILTPQTGKNAAYYPQTKLAAHRTNQFMQLAIRSLGIGGSLVLLGILAIGFKKLRARMHQNQPVWHN